MAVTIATATTVITIGIITAGTIIVTEFGSPSVAVVRDTTVIGEARLPSKQRFGALNYPSDQSLILQTAGCGHRAVGFFVMHEPAQRKIVIFLGIALLASETLFAGSESITDVKDHSKEVPALQKSWCQPPQDWEFRLGLPGWMAGLSGDFGVRGIVTNQDVAFTEILKRLDMIASGSLFFRYQRWEFGADGLYLKLSDTASLRGILFDSARVSLKQAFAESFVGYRLINCEAGFLSLTAGARYNYMNGDLHLRRALLNGRRFSGDIDWVDPVVGLHGRVRIWKPISLYAEGDVGGFDANSDSAFQLERQGLRIVSKPVDSSDWSYQVQGGLEIQLTRWMWSQLGWRYLKYDYATDGFVNKTDMSGPFVQGGINF